MAYPAINEYELLDYQRGTGHERFLEYIRVNSSRPFVIKNKDFSNAKLQTKTKFINFTNSKIINTCFCTCTAPYGMKW